MGLESNLNLGRKYSPLPKEIEEVRRQAIEAGRNPDEAEAAFLKKLEMANARAAEEESEKALDSLAGDIQKGLKP